ncbi:hypothetical protein MKEN_00162000 [Mycena kentingensis (nom. inval.)]|nr:hypothetical protein MKEN_00162000 [Mycena kentingensis (nom. inval.)]
MDDEDYSQHILSPGASEMYEKACRAESTQIASVVVADNARNYNVPINGGSIAAPVFGDKIVNVVQNGAGSEELAIARGYRTLPLADIELCTQRCTRENSRTYTGRIGTRAVTVYLHRGNKQAKREWEEEIQASLRHFGNPWMMQLFAAASIPGIYAVIYHGDWIPIQEYLSAERLPLRRAEVRLKWSLIENCRSFRMMLLMYLSPKSQAFVRPETREIVYRSSERDDRSFDRGDGSRMALMNPPLRNKPLKSIYDMWRRNFDGWYEIKQRTWDGVAELYFDGTHESVSRRRGGIGERNFLSFTAEFVKLTKRSVRIMRRDVWILRQRRRFRVQIVHTLSVSRWLCQADHFLRRSRGIKREDLRFVGLRSVEVELFPVSLKMPHAFLFLAPPETVFLPGTVIQDVAYWSFHRDGSERLNAAEARARGLPTLTFNATIGTIAYPDSVYEEFRAIHKAMGFDPDSTEIADHLGYPILELIPPALPRGTKNHFFDEEWEDGDTSIQDLFPLVGFSDAESQSERGGTRFAGLTLIDLFLFFFVGIVAITETDWEW